MMNEIIENLREAARTLVRELRVVDGSGAVSEFSLPECHILLELERRGVATASELAETLVTEKSTVSRLVSRLTEAGLVAQTRCQNDRRRRPLTLTSDGRTKVLEIHDRANEQVRRALSFVAESERAEMVAGIQRYAKALRYARLADRFHIRPIRAEDTGPMAQVIRDVMTEFGAVGEGYSINDPEVSDMFGAYQGTGSAYFVVTGPGGEVLGGGGIGPLVGGDADTCELKKMYFLPELRGSGMGLRLLRHCLHTARLLGYDRCYLETLDSMRHARKLYRKVGFAELDSARGATGHSGCNRWMMLELNQPARAAPAAADRAELAAASVAGQP